eukprot:6489123-Amphidinium_carterae.1
MRCSLVIWDLELWNCISCNGILKLLSLCSFGFHLFLMFGWRIRDKRVLYSQAPKGTNEDIYPHMCYAGPSTIVGSAAFNLLVRCD